MPSSFYGLELGRRALTANQLALDVVGQNTSNVSTPGYSRQVANFDETDPYGLPGVDSPKPAQLGTGVTVASITRVRDQFIDNRLLSANSDQGSLNNLRDVLGRVETTYGEPSSTGIGSQLTAFFGSFADLSATPESGTVRSNVQDKAQALVSAFHQVSAGLSQIGPELQSQVASKIGDVNNIATQIATLNKQIRSSVANGDQPNDLLDKRSALVSQLSGLVNVQVIDGTNPQSKQSDGQIQINVGGFTLVQSDSAYNLPTTFTTKDGHFGLTASNGETIPLQGGEVFGLIKASNLTAGYQSDLNTLASNVINTVNAQHASGYGLDGVTGRAFFSGTDAATIDISPDVKNNPDAIAAAAPPTPPATPAPGNGDNSRALAALSTKAVIGQFSLNQYYNSKVAGIGADSQQFQTQADTQAKVITQLQGQQSSVSGVNLDEELTKMLQYQRAYQAAARIINVQDDVLNRIINGLGTGSSAGA